MEKPFWQSKTFWSGVVSIVTGIGIMIQHGGFAPEGFTAILGGVGAIVGRATATGPITLTSPPTKGSEKDALG